MKPRSVPELKRSAAQIIARKTLVTCTRDQQRTKVRRQTARQSALAGIAQVNRTTGFPGPYEEKDMGVSQLGYLVGKCVRDRIPRRSVWPRILLPNRETCFATRNKLGLRP